MIRAILRAIAWMFKQSKRVGKGVLGLFGGGGPAAPVDDLDEQLCQGEQIEAAREEAAAAEQAVDQINRRSPEYQVQLYAIKPAEERFMSDISSLTPQQRVWLLKRTDRELQYLSDTPLRNIAAALRGEPAAIGTVPSVRMGDGPMIELSAVGKRILEKRKYQPQLSYFIPEELADRV